MRIPLALLGWIVLLAVGCGPSYPTALTPEQLEKQRKQDLEDLRDEDRQEAEFQKKIRRR